MSDSLNLNQQLVERVLDVLAQHDAQAQQDMMINLQYLAAMIGYLSAAYPGPDSERDELLEHLHAFTKHVCDDRAAKQNQQSAQQQQGTPDIPQGKSVATDDPAVGIWKPE